MISETEVWRKSGVPPNNPLLVTPMMVAVIAKKKLREERGWHAHFTN